MPFIPVPEAVMVSVRMTQLGEQTENTLYFRALEVGGIGAMQQLTTTLITWWASEMAPILPQTTVLREIYAVDLSTATGPTATGVPNTPTAGTLINEALPNNATIAISFRTAARGRSYRGRNYIPGLVETEVANNRLSDLRATSFIDAYVALNVSTFNAGWQHCVVSRYTNKAPRNVGVITDVTQYVVTDTVVDSQRRRLPGRGR